ncbi:hypothetical protein [Ruminiclostridium cellulolyticum]|uniref:Uncharacterized protein n=1 Tax=Ruminiclostridium cellulolyticum (strain ATCC 35319 / DSM 5812 / JCM 6584 / H10) TaxID=394503 RepID=B8I3X1_RUMCH|nr:hypothetical protein [Ruminiclostridium cellulolyticum]ACL74448.1 hypothetical protein Ccel_0060 [Ruminiclostridium cellulolyticum H10]
MNYRTRWAYLRFTKKVGDNIKIPMIVLDACVGKGAGSKILTEIEGEVLELLISAEQGAYSINIFDDLINYFCPDISYTDICYSDEIITKEILMEVIKSIQLKKFVNFKDAFFDKEIKKVFLRK